MQVDVSEEPTLRQSAGPLELVRAAIGGPAQVRDKLRRFVRTVRIVADPRELDRRLDQLCEAGLVAERPSRLQLAFGARDMFRWVIVPAAAEYYASRGISFRFHQVLRFLDDPVSVVDPTGLASDPETIIGHVMQVVHLDPVYDLQLLEMFPEGVAELERQVEAMVAGTHPRAGTIGAIIEDPGYHARLLEYVRHYRAGQRRSMKRETGALAGDPHFVAAANAFATLPGFVDYCVALPRSLPALLERARRVRRFPLEDS